MSELEGCREKKHEEDEQVGNQAEKRFLVRHLGSGGGCVWVAGWQGGRVAGWMTYKYNFCVLMNIEMKMNSVLTKYCSWS